MKEHEKAWKQEQDKYCMEAKNTRLKRSEEKRKETLTKIRQQKIQETLKKLPEMEKKRLKQEEDRARILELREAKINLWKR